MPTVSVSSREIKNNLSVFLPEGITEYDAQVKVLKDDMTRNGMETRDSMIAAEYLKVSDAMQIRQYSHGYTGKILPGDQE